ncbi:cadherin-related family member 5-like [Mantella aurantiaca]
MSWQLWKACIVVNTNPTIDENSPVGTVLTEIKLGEGYTVDVEPLDTFKMNGPYLEINRVVDYEKEQFLRATLTCRKNGIFVLQD